MEHVALAIGEAIGAGLLRVGAVNPANLQRLDLLLVGSSTRGGWPTEEIHGLLEASAALAGTDVVAFDTRTAPIWNRLLPFGHAAPRIAQALENNGRNLLTPPKGFVVQGTRGT